MTEQQPELATATFRTRPERDLIIAEVQGIADSARELARTAGSQPSQMRKDALLAIADSIAAARLAQLAGKTADPLREALMGVENEVRARHRNSLRVVYHEPIAIAAGITADELEELVGRMEALNGVKQETGSGTSGTESGDTSAASAPEPTPQPEPEPAPKPKPRRRRAAPKPAE